MFAPREKITAGYGGILNQLTMRVELSALKTEEIDSLARDCIRELLNTDRLSEDDYENFRAYLAAALDESMKGKVS